MINVEDIIFIINPNSGKKQISGIINQIERNNSELIFFVSNSYSEFKEFVEKNIEKFKVFVIVGGDGTINSSVNLFYNYPAKILAIIPTGSGNGFANEMGFKKNINSLLEDILKAEIIEIDILEANDEKFINIFGLGFDSYVAHDFSKRKKRGLKSYVFSVSKSIFRFKPIFVEINSKESKCNGKYNILAVANSKQFGNNARIAPNAKPNNGSLELVLVKPFPFYYYPVFIVKLMTGKLKSSKYIDYKETNEELILKTSFNKYHIDGEPRIHEGILTIKILPKKVQFIKTKYCKL